jgi:uncharacterized protein YjeT (DUF2065 family)
LLELPCVSTQVFRKPVTDMKKLEKEMLRLIGNIDKERG